MSVDQAKKNAAEYAANLVEEGMTIGVGSGSTVYWLILELANRVKQGLRISAVPTSEETERLANETGIPLSDLNDFQGLSLTIDGADEIDHNGQLIKGGGGALLQEKIVAAASSKLVIIADSSKMVQHLGHYPLPVEVIPFGYKRLEQQIMSTGLCKKISLRERNGQTFVTDHEHYILDCEFERILDPLGLNLSLHLIPGVVETGLFINMANKAVIGYEDGRVEVINYR